jgi:signal transduction histidine kinase
VTSTHPTRNRSSPEPRRFTPGYIAVVSACLLIGIFGGNWLGTRIDNYVYDQLTRLAPEPAWAPQSVVAAIDEDAFASGGGWPGLRRTMINALEEIVRAQPKAVAIDVILHDPQDPTQDAQMAATLKRVPNLILPCDLRPGDQRWEDPLPIFRSAAVALGHVHLDRNRMDGVSRYIPLEKIGGGERRWALALEAFRIARSTTITESEDVLEIGGMLIPTAYGTGRLMRIRWMRAGAIPMVSIRDLAANHEKLRGKVVFLGVTALTAAHDRLVNPYGDELPGVMVHAQTFETLAQAHFFREASNLSWLGLCIMLAALSATVFALRSGWQAYGLGLLIILLAHTAPFAAFRGGVVLPFTTLLSVAWLTAAGAASYQFFVIERQLRRSESETRRYQQAIHFVAHEMRSPLTAIQGSSELMSRYNLNDEKRRQITDMINSESKRLARMIQTFLDVERISDGQMELKRDPFTVSDVVNACLARAQPIAERKKITFEVADELEGDLIGDRELMEYAIYNLLTNAVKYSPPETRVRITARQQGDEIRVSVEDQGIGMDAKELRQIFQKFYRTKRAEASGEAGTGIGLSIVEQIVAHHGGRIEVESQPGKGSCFTMVLKHAATVSSGR